MKLALIRDSEIYNKKLLGLMLRDRIRKSLEKSGFVVKFFNDNLSLDEAEAYLIINEPVLFLERDLQFEGEKILVSDDFTVGYLFERDFKDLFVRDPQSAIEKYVAMNNIKKLEVRALKLSEDNLKLAEKLLLSSLIKSHDGIVSRLLNRRISLRISKILAERNVTPNQISFFSFFLSILGSALFLLDTYLATLIAGIIIQLHSIIDGCDGEIARLKFMESKYGAWLDGVLDRYADFITVFCITYSLAQANSIYWIVGFFAAFASFMIAYTGDKFVATYGRAYSDSSRLSIPITRDVRLFIIFLGAIFNCLFFSLILIALLGNAESLRRILSLRNVTPSIGLPPGTVRGG
uniref:CDP-alcohol phosphatidyltransferase family protein n=1 Tax=Geoglobus ahangari TaxID=113653 RepID=A0A7C4W422_9EURY